MLSQNKKPKKQAAAKLPKDELNGAFDPLKNKHNRSTISSRGLKKWLPAILFAVFLHAALLALFLHNQNKTSTHSNINAHLSEVNKEAEKDRLNGVITVTRSEVDVSNKNQKEDQHSDETATQDKLAKDSNSNKYSIDQDNPITDSGNNLLEKERAIKAEKVTSLTTKQTKLNPTGNQGDANVRITAIQSDSVRSMNPNDAVLLSRDLPSSKREATTQDQEYAEKAKEIESINDKISDAIQAVKQKNIQNIEASKRYIAPSTIKSQTQNPVGKIVVDASVTSQNNVNTEKPDSLNTITPEISEQKSSVALEISPEPNPNNVQIP